MTTYSAVLPFPGASTVSGSPVGASPLASYSPASIFAPAYSTPGARGPTAYSTPSTTDGSAFGDPTWQHRFWLQILGDHARMIESKLAITEMAFLEQARNLKVMLDREVASVMEGKTDTARINVTIAESMAFKGRILARYLEGKIALSMAPTFINHMLNEEEMYLTIVKHFEAGKPVDIHVLHQHKLWLKDAEGHADALKCELDAIEGVKRKKLMKLCKKFKMLSEKAHEFVGYMRSGVRDFPALGRLADDSSKAILLFAKCIKELKEMKDTDQVMSISSTLEYDHMLREEAYYLEGLAYTYRRGDIGTINVDPVAERKE